MSTNFEKSGILGRSKVFSTDSKGSKNIKNTVCCSLAERLKNILVIPNIKPKEPEAVIEITCAYDLLEYYEGVADKGGKLPGRAEISKNTGLTVYKLSALNKELIANNKLISTGNSLKLNK